MQPDATDWELLDILCREVLANTTIAKKLKVSEGLVRSRIKRLKEAGIMKIRALLDPDVLENQQMAIIGVKIAESLLLRKKAAEIADLENVLSVSIISGRYDFFVEVLVDSNRGLVNFLTESLSQVAGIANTETFVVLKSYNKFV